MKKIKLSDYVAKYLLDNKLKIIMQSIHQQCINHGKEGDYINYIKGANIAGFIKVADSMLDQGVV